MAGISDLLPASGGGKLRYQVFTSSGTFTPSAKLLANGGQCLVERIGGGGSGAAALNSVGACSMRGANSGQRRVDLVTLAGAATVTIGAGGAAVVRSTTFGVNGNVGGDTTFTGLAPAIGGAAGVYSSTPNLGRGGDGIGGRGIFVTDTTTVLDARGGAGIDGKGGGGPGMSSYGDAHMTGVDGASNSTYVASPAANVVATAADANSGAGGGCAMSGNASFTATSGAGGSGWCRVTWFE